MYHPVRLVKPVMKKKIAVVIKIATTATHVVNRSVLIDEAGNLLFNNLWTLPDASISRAKTRKSRICEGCRNLSINGIKS